MDQADSAGEEERESRIRGKLDEARRELLETSVRSRLLHTPLESSRTKIIEVVDELADEVYSRFVKDGTKMSFRSARSERASAPDDAGVGLLDHESTDAQTGRAASILHTALPLDTLQTRLRGIDTDARTFESEQGVNVLFLAIGFLEWRENHAPEKPRYGPLILVPASLSRTTANSRFKLSFTGEELQTNLSLQQRLKEEGVDLPELPELDDLVPSEYAAVLNERISACVGWRVQGDRIALGLFSFGRLMMYRDLDATLWPPRTNPAKHSLIATLLDGHFTDDSPAISDDAETDSIVDIADAAHVVDADSSQTLVLHEIERGRHLVVQGPPGTGKSQTITNVIAGAVRKGKRVLFVAEKMAALNVVRSNLDRVGLGDVCLELHSHKSRKKDVLQSLRDTFESDRSGAPDQHRSREELRRARDELNAHARRMHTALVPSAETPFSVFGTLARLTGRGVAAPDFELIGAAAWTREQVDLKRELVQRLATHVDSMGRPSQHPWRGSGLGGVLPQDAQRFGSRAQAAAADVGESVKRAGALAKRVDTTCPTWQAVARLTRLGELIGAAPDLDVDALPNSAWSEQPDKIAELVTAGLSYASVSNKLASVVVSGAWEVDASGVRRSLTAHGQGLLRLFNAEYRAAVSTLKGMCHAAAPKKLEERLGLLDDLVQGQRSLRFLRQHDAVGQAAFGRRWNGPDSDWASLGNIVVWEAGSRKLDLPDNWRRNAAAARPWKAFSEQTASLDTQVRQTRATVEALFRDVALDLTEAFGENDNSVVALQLMEERLTAWSAQPARIREWSAWRVWSRQLVEQGAAELVARLADGRMSASSAPDAFDFAYFDALARRVFALHPELAQFEGRVHDGVVAEFRRLDEVRAKLVRAEVRAAHLAAIPRGGAGVGEVGTLTHEWNKKARHLPLRTLIAKAGNAMQQIKPVWMMSPMSLAQYVPQGALAFDLVVMDEASQVTPVDALGAIARASQLVVVGDEKQLPPTPFFDRIAGNDELPEDSEDDPTAIHVADIESILGLCSAQGVPSRMLRWHYRSQHESLIAVSNLEFYKRLYIVPSATSDELGLRFRKVQGVYDRGRTRTNLVEAREVATAIIDHARQHRVSARHPDGLSLGVGTFNVAQRDAILDEIELLRHKNPELEEFFDSDAAEPFFVKNLESIQGDERDVIFISIGYGPDEGGYTSMFFGPLSMTGGERRLNVLISRARRRCEVFSSIGAGDIDLDRASNAGVRVLKTFLQYAETGALDRVATSDRAAGSDFEEDVAQALTAIGYQIEQQVGVAGFFVDLAVKDLARPGSYLLGIECDGWSYHSSRSARDRDRIREDVLRQRGWNIHRIWSTDWFTSRDQELRRAITAITAARQYKPTAAQPRQIVAAAPANKSEEHAPTHSAGNHQPEVTDYAKYVEASFREEIACDPYEVPLWQRVEIVSRIVAIEGPIHREEITRRYTAVCGKGRAGGRIDAAVFGALREAVRANRVCVEKNFYMPEPMTECAPRDRSAVESSALRKAAMLPPVEIRTALLSIVRDHVGVTPTDAIPAAARLFGFQRTGRELEEVIEDQLRTLLGNGMLELRNGDRLYFARSQ